MEAGQWEDLGCSANGRCLCVCVSCFRSPRSGRAQQEESKSESILALELAQKLQVAGDGRGD